jgi:hypothetical protein
MRTGLASVFALLALAACSGGQTPAPRATPTPALRNPLGVALYPHSEIIAVHTFRQVVTAEQTRGTVFSSGAGAYDGTEVIAVSVAPLSALAAWAHRLGAHANTATQQYGFDYAAFERTSGGKSHGTLVIVMDPQTVNRQAGSVLDLISHYRSLPQFMRGPIDQQVKQRIGVTLTDAMQPGNPIGATLDAIGEFGQRNSRGIVVIDAVRANH